MVIARRDVSNQGPEGVEGRVGGPVLLEVVVDLDFVHGHVAGAFDHDLHVVFPGPAGELTDGFQLGELSGVVGIGQRAGAQAIAE